MADNEIQAAVVPASTWLLDRKELDYHDATFIANSQRGGNSQHRLLNLAPYNYKNVPTSIPFQHMYNPSFRIFPFYQSTDNGISLPNEIEDGTEKEYSSFFPTQPLQQIEEPAGFLKSPHAVRRPFEPLFEQSQLPELNDNNLSFGVDLSRFKVYVAVPDVYNI